MKLQYLKYGFLSACMLGITACSSEDDVNKNVSGIETKMSILYADESVDMSDFKLFVFDDEENSNLKHSTTESGEVSLKLPPSTYSFISVLNGEGSLNQRIDSMNWSSLTLTQSISGDKDYMVAVEENVKLPNTTGRLDLSLERLVGKVAFIANDTIAEDYTDIRLEIKSPRKVYKFSTRTYELDQSFVVSRTDTTIGGKGYAAELLLFATGEEEANLAQVSLVYLKNGTEIGRWNVDKKIQVKAGYKTTLKGTLNGPTDVITVDVINEAWYDKDVDLDPKKEIVLNDYNFREYLNSIVPNAVKYSYDSNWNTIYKLDVTHPSVKAVEVMDFSHRNIYKAEGLEYFTGLKRLVCNNNNIDTLDLRRLTLLESVKVNNNALRVLRVRGIAGLDTLDASNNGLQQLDMTGLSGVSVLNLSGNSLNALNIPGTVVSCDLSDNQLDKIDLSKSAALKVLNLNGNAMKSLSLSGVTALDSLYCNDNALEALDITGATALKSLQVYGASQTLEDIAGLDAITLSSLNTLYIPTKAVLGTNVKAYYFAKKGTANFVMKYGANSNFLMDYNDEVASGDVLSVTIEDANFRDVLKLWVPDAFDGDLMNPKHPSVLALTDLSVRSSNISSLQGIEYFTNMRNLDVAYNNLTKLDVSMLSKLNTLAIGDNGSLAELNVVGLSKLESISGTVNYSSNYSLKSINLTGLTALKSLNLRYYRGLENIINGQEAINLQNLNLETCTSLQELNFANMDSLKSVNVESCYKLTSIDLSGCRKLTSLSAYTDSGSDYSQLTNVNLSDCENLSYVSIYNHTSLSNLKLTNCVSLRSLYCYNCNLKQLNLSDCSLISNLSCHTNKLTSLDITNFSFSFDAGSLYCYGNPLTDIIGLSGATQTGLSSLSIPSGAICGSNIKRFYKYCKENGRSVSIRHGINGDSLFDYTDETCP